VVRISRVRVSRLSELVDELRRLRARDELAFFEYIEGSTRWSRKSDSKFACDLLPSGLVARLVDAASRRSSV
jgi:hypothetical protein